MGNKTCKDMYLHVFGYFNWHMYRNVYGQEGNLLCINIWHWHMYKIKKDVGICMCIDMFTFMRIVLC